ncbi:MAG: B12-binding domain-containing radical SAM protein [Vicingaceae bacterium]
MLCVSLTGRPIEDALSITQKVKKQVPNIPTIWGGWHASLFPTQPLEEEISIDITVQGQGENTFKELVESFIKKGSLEAIKGICYRTAEGNIKKNPPRPMVNMDELPSVDYELVDVEDYFIKKGKRQFDYISSVGCFYRCTFCSDPYVFNRKFSAISSERMSNELEKHYKKYEFTTVNFQDETFFTYKDRVIEMADELVKRNVKVGWAATMRADQGDRLSQSEFNLLAKSGLKRVLVGVESGSQEMMDWLKKDIKIEQVTSTAEKCLVSKIAIQFPFIVGFPNESEEAFSKSLDFATHLSVKSKNFVPTIFYFKPYPGTPITDDVVKKGYRLPENLREWANFDYVSSSGPWVSNDRFVRVERLKFYIRLSKSKYKISYPLKWVAKKRMKNKYFKYPLEKIIIDKIKPSQKLS